MISRLGFLAIATCTMPAIAAALPSCYIYGYFDCTGTCGGQVKTCELEAEPSPTGIVVTEWSDPRPKLCFTYSVTISSDCDNASLSAAGWYYLPWCGGEDNCCWTHFDFSTPSHEGPDTSFPVGIDTCFQPGGLG